MKDNESYYYCCCCSCYCCYSLVLTFTINLVVTRVSYASLCCTYNANLSVELPRRETT